MTQLRVFCRDGTEVTEMLGYLSLDVKVDAKPWFGRSVMEALSGEQRAHAFLKACAQLLQDKLIGKPGVTTGTLILATPDGEVLQQAAGDFGTAGGAVADALPAFAGERHALGRLGDLDDFLYDSAIYFHGTGDELCFLAVYIEDVRAQQAAGRAAAAARAAASAVRRPRPTQRSPHQRVAPS